MCRMDFKTIRFKTARWQDVSLRRLTSHAITSSLHTLSTDLPYVNNLKMECVVLGKNP